MDVLLVYFSISTNAEMVVQLQVTKKTLMSWISRAINLITFSVIFYLIKCVVLNAALLLPPRKMVILQMLHVPVGLRTLRDVRVYLRTATNCALTFCFHSAYPCSDIKKNDWAWVHIQN